MADYEYLTAEDQAAIVAKVRASVPLPEAGQIDRERAHFEAVLLAEAGMGEMPDPLGPDESPDVATRQAFHDALDVAVAKLDRAVIDALGAEAVAVEVKL